MRCRPLPLAVLFSLLLCISGCARPTAPTHDPATVSRLESAAAGVAAWTPAVTPTDQVNFIIFGDWGDNSKRQHEVAATLNDYAAATSPPFHAVLSTGDNFYINFKEGIADPQWRKLFEEMYDATKVNFPFYVTLGNHDYDHRIDRVQFEYAAKLPQSRFKLPANWYRLEFPQEQPLVTVLMLDSNYERLSKEQWAEQLRWMESELAKPRRTPWLIAVAHHTLFSNGDHGDNRRLQQEWGTLFRKYGVDFYFCGHDHALQHLEPDGWPVSFVISGGGGRSRKPMKRNDRGPFSRSIYGFAHAKFTPTAAEVIIIDGLNGEVAHQFTRTTDRQVAVVKTTPSDKPTVTAAARVNTPAHRAIKPEDDDYKQMAALLSFTSEYRPAFDKAVKAELPPAEHRRNVLHTLPPAQVRRWAGYVLYSSIINTFDPVGLSDEQKQQAFAACAAIAAPATTMESVEKDPFLKPTDEMRTRAITVIHDQVLSTVQRRKLAEHDGRD